MVLVGMRFREQRIRGAVVHDLRIACVHHTITIVVHAPFHHQELVARGGVPVPVHGGVVQGCFGHGGVGVVGGTVQAQGEVELMDVRGRDGAEREGVGGVVRVHQQVGIVPVAHHHVRVVLRVDAAHEEAQAAQLDLVSKAVGQQGVQCVAVLPLHQGEAQGHVGGRRVVAVVIGRCFFILLAGREGQRGEGQRGDLVSHVQLLLLLLRL